MWSATCASLIGVALLLSFSRGAWLSGVIAALFIAPFLFAWCSRPERRLRVGGAVVGLAGLVLIGGATVLQFESVRDLIDVRVSLDQSYDYGPDGRFGGQAKAADLVLENPFGIGAFTFRERHHHEEAHNVYLSQFMNAGWVGGFAYIALSLALLIGGTAAALRGGPLQVPIMIAAAAMAGLIVEGLIIDTDHWRHAFLWQAILMGLVDGRRRLQPAAASVSIAKSIALPFRLPRFRPSIRLPGWETDMFSRRSARVVSAPAPGRTVRQPVPAKPRDPRVKAKPTVFEARKAKLRGNLRSA
ncbi:MAG: O-antigen ligase family protein [Pseudomonadota bacterium]